MNRRILQTVLLVWTPDTVTIRQQKKQTTRQTRCMYTTIGHQGIGQRIADVSVVTYHF